MTDSNDMKDTGMAINVWEHLLNEVRQRGGRINAVHRLASPDGKWLIGSIADKLIRVDDVWAKHYRVVTDHASLDEAVAAAGFDTINNNVAIQLFLKDGAVAVNTDVYLIHKRKFVTYTEILREFEELGLQAAKPYELLGLFECHPKLRETIAVVGLGVIWREYCIASRYDPEDRKAVLEQRDAEDWDDDWWFAATPKVASNA